MRFYWCFAVADGSGDFVGYVMQAIDVRWAGTQSAVSLPALSDCGAPIALSKDETGSVLKIEATVARKEARVERLCGLPNVGGDILGTAHFGPTTSSRSTTASITSKTMQPMVSRDWRENVNIMLPSHPRVSTLS
jgi:hypothetical protein